MDQVVNFLFEHWKLILIICCVLVEMVFAAVNFLILLVKGHPIDNALTAALLKLPELINQAEASGLDGEKKYTYVYTAVMCLLESLTKLNQQKVISKYGFIIDSSIEDILSTPSKKKGV